MLADTIKGAFLTELLGDYRIYALHAGYYVAKGRVKSTLFSLVRVVIFGIWQQETYI